MKCEQKKRFTTKARARQAASRAEKIRGIELHVYKCPRCGYWHITSQPQELAQQLKGAA